MTIQTLRRSFRVSRTGALVASSADLGIPGDLFPERIVVHDAAGARTFARVGTSRHPFALYHCAGQRLRVYDPAFSTGGA